MTRLTVGVDIGGPSHDRCAMVAVEEVVSGQDRLKVVTLAERLAKGTSPSAQADTIERLILELSDQIGHEPVTAVEWNAYGVAVVDLLDQAKRAGRIRKPVVAVTLTNARRHESMVQPTFFGGGRVVASLNVGSGRRDVSVSKNDLVARLYGTYTRGLLRFADSPGIARLRDEMAGFTPKETASGATTFGNDPTLVEYDDLVVALMYAAYFPGRGVPRFMADGQLFESQSVAHSILGSGAGSVEPAANKHVTQIFTTK